MYGYQFQHFRPRQEHAIASFAMSHGEMRDSVSGGKLLFDRVDVEGQVLWKNKVDNFNMMCLD